MNTKANETHTKAKNRFRNNDKAIGIGNTFWDTLEQNGLAGIVAELNGNQLQMDNGHSFVNFSSCSYLGLDQDSRLIQGAIDALNKYGVLDHCIPRTRVQIPALLKLEHSLSTLFDAHIISAISASVATSGLLPLIASGHLLDSLRPVMIFDKNCHVSMNQIKPICADETDIMTCRHHDLEFIEAQCKKYRTVCYVCDGSDSLGGYAPVRALTELQEKYGLYVFYDDSHSISAYGPKGVGYIRSHLDEINPRTFIVATLNKAFGSSGAAIMLGRNQPKRYRIIDRFAGGLSYSQPMNIAAIGASLASAEIHHTPEITTLQNALQSNIALFDKYCPSPFSGMEYPIRLIDCDAPHVIEIGKQLFSEGFYVSPVFFPIVARGKAGLRVMIRANHSKDTVIALANALAKNQSTHTETATV